jgi:3-oxoacyl-[acyl-carrier protein] reductase
MMKSIKPLIVVTGGSRGLGQGIIRHLLKHEYSIATMSRQKSKFIEEMQHQYDETCFYWQELDVTDPLGQIQFIDTVYNHFGRLDGLINNAGVAVDGVLTLMNEEDISKVLTLNLETVIKISRLSIKKMLLSSKGGSIINISSIIGIRGYSGLSVYSASKAGMDGFTRALARELGARKIRVNSIAPGYLDTEMSSTLSDKKREQIIRRTPLARLGKVDDVAGVVSFLLSDSAKFITGQTLVVDGGITC